MYVSLWKSQTSGVWMLIEHLPRTLESQEFPTDDTQRELSSISARITELIPPPWILPPPPLSISRGGALENFLGKKLKSLRAPFGEIRRSDAVTSLPGTRRAAEQAPAYGYDVTCADQCIRCKELPRHTSCVTFATHQFCLPLFFSYQCQKTYLDLTAARPNCKSRSAPYHTPHGSRRATDRPPDGSLTETGRKIRRTLGAMTPAGVYAEDMPNGRRFKCDLSMR
ncbi:hypothetical protein Bbelb_146580 [Branchiostoma belcheri]|nr:hypothetical protein Bbelb_146580 [Branchiostoma belcheri]